MFETLTKYIEQIKDIHSGQWVIDEENGGTPQHPIQMPYVSYDRVVFDLSDDVYKFHENHSEYDLGNYREILQRQGVYWGSESMCNSTVDDLNAEAILALIMGAVRSERFFDCVLLEFFDSGTKEKWLLRLKTFDT